MFKLNLLIGLLNLLLGCYQPFCTNMLLLVRNWEVIALLGFHLCVRGVWVAASQGILFGGICYLWWGLLKRHPQYGYFKQSQNPPPPIERPLGRLGHPFWPIRGGGHNWGVIPPWLPILGPAFVVANLEKPPVNAFHLEMSIPPPLNC